MELCFCRLPPSERPNPCLLHLLPPDFFCLYNGNDGLSQRSGASLDVYAPPPPVRHVQRMHTCVVRYTLTRQFE